MLCILNRDLICRNIAKIPATFYMCCTWQTVACMRATGTDRGAVTIDLVHLYLTMITYIVREIISKAFVIVCNSYIKSASNNMAHNFQCIYIGQSFSRLLAITLAFCSASFPACFTLTVSHFSDIGKHLCGSITSERKICYTTFVCCYSSLSIKLYHIDAKARGRIVCH